MCAVRLQAGRSEPSEALERAIDNMQKKTKDLRRQVTYTGLKTKHNIYSFVLDYRTLKTLPTDIQGAPAVLCLQVAWTSIMLLELIF